MEQNINSIVYNFHNTHMAFAFSNGGIRIYKNPKNQLNELIEVFTIKVKENIYIKFIFRLMKRLF